MNLEVLNDFEAYAEAFLKIPTKDPDNPLIAFKLNRVQKEIWRIVDGLMKEGRPVRIIVLKARQLGISTLIQGIMHWFVTTHTERNALTVAHDFDASQNLQKMQSCFYKNHKIKPSVRAWSRSVIEFDTERHKADPGLQSKIFIDTAANTNLGRSYTIHFLHGSEVAAWERVSEGFGGIKQLFASLNQSIPDKPGTFKFLESTAQGEGYFKNLWDDNHRKPGAAYLCLFYSWVAFDEYRTVRSQPFVLGDSDDSTYGDEVTEKGRVLDQLKLWYPELDEDGREAESWRRLRWRRNKIDTDCEHDVMIFRQEFPTCPEDAFSAAGIGIFDQFVLSDRLREIQPETELLVKHTNLRFNSVAVDSGKDWERRAFQPSRHGELTVFEDPAPEFGYVIGADSCYGVEGDKAGAVVLKVNGLMLDEVATYNGNIDADEFGELLYALGMAYNRALLAPEIDGPGLSTIHRLEKLHYPTLFYMRELQRPGQPTGPRYGWHTNVGTKPVMVNKMRQVIRDGYIRFNHPETIRQHRAYRQVAGQRSGYAAHKKFEAAAGFHDDLVIAAMIAVQLTQQTHMRPQVLRAPDRSKQWKFWADQAKSQEKESLNFIPRY